MVTKDQAGVIPARDCPLCWSSVIFINLLKYLKKLLSQTWLHRFDKIIYIHSHVCKSGPARHSIIINVTYASNYQSPRRFPHISTWMAADDVWWDKLVQGRAQTFGVAVPLTWKKGTPPPPILGVTHQHVPEWCKIWSFNEPQIYF